MSFNLHLESIYKKIEIIELTLSQ